jgi:hypothetical protein
MTEQTERETETYRIKSYEEIVAEGHRLVDELGELATHARMHHGGKFREYADDIGCDYDFLIFLSGG